MRGKNGGGETGLVWIVELAGGRMDVQEAALRLGVCERQAWRLLRKYNDSGAAGLLHGLCGKPSNRRHAGGLKERILDLVRETYFDCGPTLASEMLMEEKGIAIHPETLRLWMKSAGLLNRIRKRKPHRQKRERMGAFGQMLQIDGSFHAWFGDEKTCLINLIDDATSRNLCRFDTHETTRAAALLLWEWICKHGIPQSIYCDRRNAYISSELTEATGFFGQMCKRLGIRVIPAFSPQAKGRVERSNQTHQDRLIPKLRLRGITTLALANAYLQRHYLPHHNAKFAVAPTLDVHRKLPPNTTLDDICHMEVPRKVNNDWTVKFEGKTFQIKRKNYCPAKSTVIVRQCISGEVKLLFRNSKLDFKER